MRTAVRFRRALAVDWASAAKRAAAVLTIFAFSRSVFAPEAVCFAAFCAAVFFGMPLTGMAAFFSFSLLQGGLTYDTVLVSLVPAAVFLALSTFFARFHGKVGTGFYCAFLTAAQAVSVYGMLGSGPLSYALLSFAVSLLMFLVLVNALKAPLLRGLRTQLATDEKVSVCIVIAVFFAGISGLVLPPVEIGTMLAVFACLMALHVAGPKTALVLALSLGVGRAMVTQSGTDIGVFALLTLFASVFIGTSRWLSALSAVLCDLLLAYALNIYPVYGFSQLLSVSAGAALFMLIPDRALALLKESLSGGVRELESGMIKRSRARMSSRLVRMGQVFAEMDTVFTSLCRGYMPKDDAVEYFLQDFSERVCGECENSPNCLARPGKMREAVAKLLDSGIERGKITLIDIPDWLAKKCARTNVALQVINHYCTTYRQHAAAMSNLDNTRMIIAKQLAGVSRIMLALSENCGSEISFNTSMEKAIKDELLSARINCREAVAYSERGSPRISVMVSEEHSLDPAVSGIVSKAAGTAMMVGERSECKRPGYRALSFRPAPRFDVIFGSASCPKAGEKLSGDTHSLINLSEDRFMLALCDGMGSGERAENLSSGSISLIENFYRAGFDSELILNSVNGLMASCCEEAFCAIDIVVTDLKSGRCDFIKLGAVPSFILRGGEVSMVNGSSLPLGILEESSPSTTVTKLNGGDLCVLVSDGVLDAFSGVEKFAALLRAQPTSNPQELADALFSAALSKYRGRPKDDMTVLTLRIFEKA